MLVAVFGVMVILKIGKIQLVDGKMWKERAAKSTFRERIISATRGNIYAEDGSLLATSLPFYRVAFDPTVLKDNDEFSDNVDSLAEKLSLFFKDKSKDTYRRMLTDARGKRKRYLKIGDRKINYHEKKQMMSYPIFKRGRYKGGVIFEKLDTRFTPFNNLAKRTVGRLFIDLDSVNGKEVEVYRGTGLEYSFNKELAGKNGYGIFQKAPGGWLPILDRKHSKPENGNDIYTTIDINIQDVAERALLRTLEDNDALYGSVILMEVATGEIKAIANLGKTKDGTKYYERNNYAVGREGNTDPGSTFKLASMIALFEERGKKLKLSDTINCFAGRYNFHDAVMTDAKYKGYGILTVKEVMAKSSNIGVSRLVVKYFKSNPQRFIDYLYDMGLSDTLGFQIKGEARPFIKQYKDESWSGTTLPWTSIGYEMKMSPLQILALYNAVANNGVKIKPIIVKEVRHADEVVARYETEVLNKKICSKRTLEMVKKQLEEVVLTGTARSIKTSKYKIAGKTGTAQKLKNGTYVRKYSTSFVGYFPADKPKYSCIVVVDQPQGDNQEGSNVAAPVFREIADKVYSRDLVLHQEVKLNPNPKTGVFPSIKAGNKEELKEICDELKISTHERDGGEYVRTRVNNNSIDLLSKKIKDGLVPNVIGLRLKDALFLLENQGMVVRFAGHGRVTSQSIAPGKTALRKSVIKLTLEQ